MKKLFLFLVLVSLLAMVSSAFAGEEAYRDRFYRLEPASAIPPIDTTLFRPTWNGTAWVWNGYTADMPASGTVVLASGHSIVLGMENIYVYQNNKTVTVDITYPTGDPGGLLRVTAANVGSNKGQSSYAQTQLIEDPGHLKAVYQVVPQPGWEWVLIRNTGPDPVTLNNVSIWSVCYDRAPSLTTYGLMILVLLLAGTAVWVLRRRKAVVAV